MDGKPLSQRIDKVFSRRVLGATFLGTTAGKIVEYIIKISAHGQSPEYVAVLQGYIIAFLLAMVLYMYWGTVESTINRLIESIYG